MKLEDDIHRLIMILTRQEWSEHTLEMLARALVRAGYWQPGEEWIHDPTGRERALAAVARRSMEREHARMMARPGPFVIQSTPHGEAPDYTRIENHGIGLTPPASWSATYPTQLDEARRFSAIMRALGYGQEGDE